MARDHFWGKRVIALIAATCTFGSLTLVPMATAASSADASAQQNGGQSQTDGDAANNNANAAAESNGANASDIQTDAPAAPDATGDQSQQAADGSANAASDPFTADGKGFATFKEALAEAVKTDDKTVTINQSTTENLTVDREGVTVTAAKGVELRGALTIKAENVTVKGIHFILDDKSSANLSVAAGNGTTVTGCTFDITGTRKGQFNSIWAAYVHDLTFEGNTFNIAVNVNNNSWVGINLVGPGVKNVKIINNTLNGLAPVNDTWNGKDDKGFTKAPNLYLVIANGNRSAEGEYGIENLTATGNKTFDKTGVSDPDQHLVYGISFNNVNGATFTGNAFEGYMGFAYTGWRIQTPTGSSNQAPSKGVNISNNTLDTQVGIRLRQEDVEKGGLKLKDNTFGENTQQKYDTVYSVVDQDGTTYESLDEALNAKATKVTLLSDLGLSKALTINQKVTLDGEGFGINGQLILAGGASGSTIENTHFIQNGRKNFSGFASSLRLSGASNVTITNNTFSMDEDTEVTSGRAVAVSVEPNNGEIVANTIISNNTFDITDNKVATNYHYAILLDNEGNGADQTDPGVARTTISGNTLKGQVSLARSRFLATYDRTDRKATTPRVGVKGVTIENNDLATGKGNSTDLLIDFWGGTGDITIKGNKFGAGKINVRFIAQSWGGHLAVPQKNVAIKGNTFNGNSAVLNDAKAVKWKDANGEEHVQHTEGIDFTEKFDYNDDLSGKDANTFGQNTEPFISNSGEAISHYGVTYREIGGKLLGWERVAENGKVDPKNVPTKADFTVTWYEDGQLKTPFDPAKDTVTRNLRLVAQWTPVSNGGGTTVITKKETTITGVTAQDAWFDGKAHSGYTGTPSSDFKGTYEITYSGSGSTVYGPSKDAPTAAGTYRVTISVPSSDSTWFGSLALEFSIRSGSTVVGRFYAPGQDRHMWTASAAESGVLPGMGWNREGDAFTMDEHTGNPVYRLYDPRGNQHLWTASVEERDYLVSQHWNDEGIAFYENPTATVDVYRLYNPWTGEHLWTTSVLERDSLTALPAGSAWTYEGVAFKALS